METHWVLIVILITVLIYTIWITGMLLTVELRRIANILESDWIEDSGGDGGGDLKLVPINKPPEPIAKNKRAKVVQISDWKKKGSSHT